jgi:hypothetical protein
MLELILLLLLNFPLPSLRQLAHMSLAPPPGYQQRPDFERGQAFKVCSNGSEPAVPSATASSVSHQVANPEQFLHEMTWTKGIVQWR